METRMTDYFQDITLCDEKNSAHYIEFRYDNLNKKLSYICAYGFYENMEEKSSYIDNIDSKMNLVFSNSNLKVITCFRELFELQNLWHNYGGFICIFALIVQIVLYIDYCCKGISNFVVKINNIFKEANMNVQIEQPGKENANANTNTNTNVNNNNLVDIATTANKLETQDNTNINVFKTEDNNNMNTDTPLDKPLDKPKKKKKKKKKKKLDIANPPKGKRIAKRKRKAKKKDDDDDDNDDNDNDNDDDIQKKEENEENDKRKGKKGKKKKGKKKKKKKKEKKK
jgi:hypothetical protein